MCMFKYKICNIFKSLACAYNFKDYSYTHTTSVIYSICPISLLLIKNVQYCVKGNIHVHVHVA